jgi:hypothetical protein
MAPLMKVAASTLGVLLAGVAAGSSPAPFALQRVEMKDASRTGTAGTGCTWSRDRRAGWHMSMTDDRAAVRIKGQDRILRPAAGAKDLFPFTFDRWTDGIITIELSQTGRSRRLGTEAMEKPSMLRLTTRGATVPWRGHLNCGS